MTTKTYPLSAIQEGSGMNKEQALEILMLLSAIESWGFSRDGGFMPDYLHENLRNIVDALSKEVLK